ncbi:MAG: hypothetical protein IKS31_04900 [Clostridia bacterium]|nr:hypothetical protein [Clostridia bacterium]
MTLSEVRQAVAEADPHAYHYVAASKGQAYTTWHEYRRQPLWGDGDVAEDGWAFQVDRFTKVEDDPVAEAIWRTLKANRRLTVQHLVLPDPGGYIHHVFQCEGK